MNPQPRTFATISAISSRLPERIVTTADLARDFPESGVARIAAKTGISERRVCSPGETASDLAVGAASRLFADHDVDPASIDYLLLCTQSPDFAMPTTSCLVHDRLGLRPDAGALDLGMGCSGYVYGLGIAKGLIESGQADSVLLITADTLSKYVNARDKQLRTIFGDGAAATLLTTTTAGEGLRGLSYGTDGSGARHLIVPSGGLANAARVAPEATAEARGLESNGHDMYMNGSEVFSFSLRVVPEVVERSLASSGLTADDIDLFVLHQANAFMLETLRKKLGVDQSRFVVAMADCGNTTSSSIPLAIETAMADARIRQGSTAMLVGFGVGLSWGAVVATL